MARKGAETWSKSIELPPWKKPFMEQNPTAMTVGSAGVVVAPLRRKGNTKDLRNFSPEDHETYSAELHDHSFMSVW